MKNIIKKITAKMGYQTDKKQILLLSDDWGSVRIKSKEDQADLIKKGYKVASRFDQFDSLETNEDLELLFEVLTKYKDHNGNHPCITAVTNVANPDFKKIKESDFQEYHYETIASTYLRYPDSDRVLNLTHEGIHNKIFIPQSHGREHVQVNWWMEELQNKDSFASKFFENEFFSLGEDYLLNPKRNRGIGASFDVWTYEDLINTKLIAKSSLEIFKALYSYNSKIFTPPAMFYNSIIEDEVVSLGVEWIDVGRVFKEPKIKGKESYQFNYLGKRRKSGIRVLVRNAIYETNMSSSDNGVAKCLNGIEQAFNLKQPAIISNHRASFVGGVTNKNRDKGLKSLDLLLKEIFKRWPDVEFIIATDWNV
ncbi:hypothetical protein [Flavobacterium sp.]|jgi:hypothetical protein|uniref:hypothetical protein n=1 Tax=Flavobacterium sp. TaxID=239 RepID=UPI0037C1076D